MLNATKLKHIVFVSREFHPSFQASGIASYVKESAESLVKQGIQVTVICASDDTQKEYTYHENGINVIRLSGGDFYIPEVEKNLFFIKKLRFFYRFFTYRQKIKKVIQGLKDVSLIEVADYAAEGLFLLNLNIPLVVRLHTPYLFDRKTEKVRKFSFNTFHYYWIGLLEIFILKKAVYITSCSESLRIWMANNFNIDKHKIMTIYNPLNLSSIDTVSTIFFSGRIQAEKGIEELIESVKFLREKGYKIQLLMAGKLGKLSYDLPQNIKSNGWYWCQLLGQLSREDLKKYYQNCTLSCFPSWWENMPYTCLEAMSEGGIVLCSSKGGMSEVIQDGKNGFLCTPLNSHLLAQKIEQIILLTNLEREIISKNAEETIRKRFSANKWAETTIEYYNQMLHNQPPDAPQ